MNYSGQVKGISECNVYTEYNTNEIQKLIPDFIASEPYCKNEYKHDMSVWHSLYRNELIRKNNLRFVSERIYSSEDIPFQIDFLQSAKKVAFIPDRLYYYCYNEASLTKKVDRTRFELIKSTYRLLSNKTKVQDSNGLRAKRLFIGNIRMYLRKVVKSPNAIGEK